MALVLIVEDTRDNREIYRTILEYAGHTVIEAVHGEDGVALAGARQPEVIVMDVTMPVMDGRGYSAAQERPGHTAHPGDHPHRPRTQHGP